MIINLLSEKMEDEKKEIQARLVENKEELKKEQKIRHISERSSRAIDRVQDLLEDIQSLKRLFASFEVCPPKNFMWLRLIAIVRARAGF